eukprot:gene4988-5230_t
MQVEAVVWKHFFDLVQDILSVMQLSGVAAVAASAHAGLAADESAPTGQLEPLTVADPAGSRVSVSSAPCSSSTAVLEMITQTDARVAPLSIALEELATSLLFPCLLPFLAAHGLYNTMKLGADAGSAATTSAGAWYWPLTGFEDEVELRYLAWKQRTLLHLDYFASVFEIFYLAVLIRKMLRQPSTVFYLFFILIKTLPHVPLMLGFRETYLRYRELWLFLVAPVCLAMVLVSLVAVNLFKVGEVPGMLTTKALQAYWRSRGEVSTSVLRPFLQHMRLRPYIWYVVLDAAMSVWVFGQVYGHTAAASRWGVAAGLSMGLCWGLELYMRRLFVNRHASGMLLLESGSGDCQPAAVVDRSGKGKLD